MNHFKLTFEGYWLGRDIATMPSEAGVYCVYASHFDPVSRTVIPTRLLYIDECMSLQSSALENCQTGWLQKYLMDGEELCYALAPILFGRRQACAALVFRHKPAANFAHRYRFAFAPTHVELSGAFRYLRPSFNVPDAADQHELTHDEHSFTLNAA